MKKRIAIQGYAGSFHDIAAKKFFGDQSEVVACNTFRQLFRTVNDDTTIDAAVIAIENSIAGSILPNYSLLQNSNLLVTGEVYLPVSQNLLAYPGVKVKDIREVHTHPMALLQCADFLDTYHWKQVETEDTALSARMISEKKMKHVAAIGSSLAAEMYHLNILEENIQTEKTNLTRFLVLQRQVTNKNEDANKASVFFEVSHHAGSLARVLSLIASCRINLSKIQSVPVPKVPWKYAFHADMEFDLLTDFNKAIDKVKDATEKLIIYGVYERGEQNGG